MEILQSKQDLSHDQRNSRVLKVGASISNEREEITACHKLGEHVARTNLAKLMSNNALPWNPHCIPGSNDLLDGDNVWLGFVSASYILKISEV
jgi:hypothetical protein